MIVTLAQIDVLLACSALLGSKQLLCGPDVLARRRVALLASASAWVLAVVFWLLPPGGESLWAGLLRFATMAALAAAIVLVVRWTRAYRRIPGATASPPMARRIGNLVVFGAVASLVLWGGILLEQWRMARIPEAPHRATFEPDSPQARLLGHVTQLAVRIGERSAGHPEQRRLAAQYVAEQFRKAGYEPQSQTFKLPFGGVVGSYENVSVVLPGRALDSPVLVVGAHYDSAVGTPGADDNASGVAAVLELARRLKGSSGDVELQFVAFANEEPPFFGSDEMGSYHFAEMLKQQHRRLVGMMSLEMLGCYAARRDTQAYIPFMAPFFPARGNFIGIASNWSSWGFMRRLKRAFPQMTVPLVTAALPQLSGAVNLSDNLSFWRNGFPAVMVTDTAFLRNRNYHAKGDVPGTIDFDRMAMVVDGLETAIREMRH